jgi:hypothetical protein
MVIMKHAAICIFLTLALAAQASAVLRPLYPVKPTPPFRGQVIIIGSDSLSTPPKSVRK